MQVEKAARESEVIFCSLQITVFPSHYVRFYTKRLIHLNSFCRLRLSEKYLVKILVEKNEKRK